jgi:anti-sigma B factor antagonist
VGDRVVLAVVGELDVFTSPVLRDRLLDLVASGCYDLIVDLSEVTFLDSTAMGVFVGGRKRVLAHRGSFALAGPRESIARLFRMTGLDKLLCVHASLDDALAAS